MKTLILLLCLALPCVAQEIQVAPMAFKAIPPVVAESFAIVGSQIGDTTVINGNADKTFNYTVSANTSGLLVVWIAASGGADSIYGVTWNGDALTRYHGYNASGPDFYLYAIKVPDAGARALVIDYGETEIYGKWINAGLVEFSGVNQTTPFNTIKDTSGGTGNGTNNNWNVTIPSATGELVTGILMSTKVISTSETVAMRTGAGRDYNCALLAVQESGSSSVLMSGTVAENFEYYRVLAVSVKPQ